LRPISYGFKNEKWPNYGSITGLEMGKGTIYSLKHNLAAFAKICFLMI
jgi:hypothetical protein